MQRITKILTVVGIFIMVMVTNYHDVSANYKADYYLRTGSRNLLLAKSFHVDLMLILPARIITLAQLSILMWKM